MQTLDVKTSDKIHGHPGTTAKQSDSSIGETITKKLELQKLELFMIEGYQAGFQEDLAIAKEFEIADFQNL